MSRPKMKIVGVLKSKDKTGKEINILKLAPGDEAPCRECKKKPRQMGSSRCKGCSDQYRTQQHNNSRLQKKITEAQNKK